MWPLNDGDVDPVDTVRSCRFRAPSEAAAALDVPRWAYRRCCPPAPPPRGRRSCMAKGSKSMKTEKVGSTSLDT